MDAEAVDAVGAKPDAAGRVELVTPAGREWRPVIRLVLGGVANQLDMRLEELDDLQLAVERLLLEAGTDDASRVSVEVTPGGVRTIVGPLRESLIAEALRGPAPAAGELSLRRVLETVVDSYGVEVAADGRLDVRLDKLVRRG